jgi:hypothetical protein
MTHADMPHVMEQEQGNVPNAITLRELDFYAARNLSRKIVKEKFFENIRQTQS